jgi:two-component system cell cycle response regulator DivK
VKRILIIEDVELNRDLLIQLLEDTYALLEATDGKAGLDTAYRERPDLILLDLSLPVIDGWEVARQLKASAVTATIPVIALTAHAMSGDERRAKECGCDGYITKPIDDVVLLERIAALIGEDR